MVNGEWVMDHGGWTEGDHVKTQARNLQTLRVSETLRV